MRIVAKSLIGCREGSALLEHPFCFFFSEATRQTLSAAGKTQVADPGFPRKVVFVVRIESSICTDHHEFERGPQLGKCRSVESVQEIEVCALEAVGRVQQTVVNLVRLFWIANRRNPIPPKIVYELESRAVMIRDPYRNIFWKVHDSVPNVLSNQLGRWRVLPGTLDNHQRCPKFRTWRGRLGPAKLGWRPVPRCAIRLATSSTQDL